MDVEKDALPFSGAAKLELFYNGLENQRFVSYGFPAWQRANVLEGRLTYNAKFTADNDQSSSTPSPVSAIAIPSPATCRATTAG